MLIDTHAHLNFPDYKMPDDSTIARCLSYPMKVINIGVDYDSSQEVIDLAKKYPENFYASVGLHPDDGFAKKFFIEKFKDLIKNNRQLVVGIGECGLDFFRWSELGDNFGKVYEQQKEIFKQQINLAKEFDLPLIIHARNSVEADKPSAYGEIIKILEQENYWRGTSHCFVGSLPEADAFLNKGFYLGFTGIITFPKGENVREIAKMCPRDKMLIETDSPFLAPQPYRGKRNEPMFVAEVAKKIAEIKGLLEDEVVEQTWQNAKQLFKLSLRGTQ